MSEQTHKLEINGYSFPMPETMSKRVDEFIEGLSDTEKAIMETFAYRCGWTLVRNVESGLIQDVEARNLAADFLESYANFYDEQEPFSRAQKLRQQTN